MKKIIFALLFTNILHAGYKVNDVIPNICWKDSKDKSQCLKDDDGKIRILLYNATWCGPCLAELRELVRRVLKKNVVYYSLTCDVAITARSLDAWDKSIGIAAHGIRALASPRDCGRDFEGSGSIPAVAVVGKDGRLKSFAVSPGVDWILGWQ